MFMTEHGKKIKEFMSDEKNLKALLTDDEFISKVSGGNATSETYMEKFKKLGLELSAEEAEAVGNTVNKIFETPTEELDDEFLKNISGSGPDYILLPLYRDSWKETQQVNGSIQAPVRSSNGSNIWG